MFGLSGRLQRRVQITVTDTTTEPSAAQQPSGNLASVADTAAFSGGNGLRGDPGQESIVETPGAGSEATGGAAVGSGPPAPQLSLSSSSEAACTASATALCLNNNRFKVEVSWRVPAQGTSGNATAIPLTGDTGQFWFSPPISSSYSSLDGPVNGQYGSHGAQCRIHITVTDTLTAMSRRSPTRPGTRQRRRHVRSSGRDAISPPTSTSTRPTPMPPRAAHPIVNVTPTASRLPPVSNSSTTTIKAGDTVQWVFQSASNYHSATSGTCTDGGDPYGGGYSTCTTDNVFDSGVQTSPATYSMTFTGAGSVPY